MEIANTIALYNEITGRSMNSGEPASNLQIIIGGIISFAVTYIIYFGYFRDLKAGKPTGNIRRRIIIFFDIVVLALAIYSLFSDTNLSVSNSIVNETTIKVALVSILVLTIPRLYLLMTRYGSKKTRRGLTVFYYYLSIFELVLTVVSTGVAIAM